MINSFTVTFQMNLPDIRTLQVFILSFEDLQVLQNFLIGVLHFEELSAEGASLLL